MKKKRFYFLLLKDNKKIGVLYAPKGTDTGFGGEITPVKGLELMTFELRSGGSGPMMTSNVYADFVNKDLKDFLEVYIPIDKSLELLPTKIRSDEYGNSEYYLIHFTKIYDVIDIEHSKVIKETGSITVPCLDYKKVENLDLLTTCAYSNGFSCI